MPIQSATIPTSSSLLFLLFSKATQAGIDYEVRSQQRRNSRASLVLGIKVGDLICWMCLLHHFRENSTPFWSEVKLSYPDTLFRLEIFFFLATLRLLLTTFRELHHSICFPKCTWPRAPRLSPWACGCSQTVSMSERKSSISSLPIFIVPSEKVLPWGAMSERTGSISPFPSSYALQKNLTLGS